MKKAIKIIRIFLLILLILAGLPLYLTLIPKSYGREIKEITAETYVELAETDEMYLSLPYDAMVTNIYVDQQLGDAYVTVLVKTPEDHLKKFSDWLSEHEKQYHMEDRTFVFSYFLSDSHIQFGEYADDKTIPLFGKVYWLVVLCLFIALFIPFEMFIKTSNKLQKE